VPFTSIPPFALSFPLFVESMPDSPICSTLFLLQAHSIALYGTGDKIAHFQRYKKPAHILHMLLCSFLFISPVPYFYSLFYSSKVISVIDEQAAFFTSKPTEYNFCGVIGFHKTRFCFPAAEGTGF
jgi:hypothetical protein